MKRRDFITLIGSAAAVCSSQAQARRGRGQRLPNGTLSFRPSAIAKNLKLGFAEIVSLAVLIAM
jgi:hypothetical protein